jgi:hypothetical protein
VQQGRRARAAGAAGALAVIAAVIGAHAACSDRTPTSAADAAAPAPATALRAAPAGGGAAAPARLAGAVPVPATPAPAAPAKEPGHDFIDDARRLFRVAACGGDGPLPPELAALQAVTDAHCKHVLPKLAAYRARYFDTAQKWFEAKAPKDLPPAAVYAFSGGDLISALVAFPRAREITTISLELAGDPRALPTLAPAEVGRELTELRREIGLLISNGSNTSVLLQAQQQNRLPGQIASFLLGLAAGGFEPVSMRFFTLDDTGAIHYLEEAEIAAARHATKSLRSDWKDPTFPEVFRHVELRFRRPGDPAVRVHRHIAWNVDNTQLAAHPQLLRHLAAKGKVAILVKGASYLLWFESFSTFRTYLLDHLAWMVADSTGIAPNHARGVVQEAYGRYRGPVVENVVGKREDLAAQALWKTSRGPMPFRFGYLDRENNAHVMLVRPK